MTRAFKSAVLLVLFLLSVTLLGAVSFTTSPSWSPTSPFTNNTLNCSWLNSSDTTHQNITIYNGSNVYNSTIENASLQNLSTSTIVPPSATTKNEQWICRIELFNATASVMQNDSVTILNSPPTTEGPGAGIFNDTFEEVGFLIQIQEDTTWNLDVNATDADNDVLTYQLSDQFCTRTSSTEGTYVCTPRQSDMNNNQPTEVNITFSVSDGQNVGGRTIVFNVTPVNDAPNLTVTNQTTPVNASLNSTFTATDEEPSYPLTYQLIAPSEVSDKLTLTPLNANGTQISVFYDASTPDFNDVGLHNITINVTDNSTGTEGQNDSISVLVTYTLNITAVGRPPYFINTTPTGPYNIQQGEFLQINITANDLDNSTITFLDDTTRFDIVTVISETNTTNATGQINFTPTNNDVGIYNVTITIQDDQFLTNTTILEFNVSNVNDPPVVNEFSFSAANTQNNQNASNLSAFANTLFIYDVNATDPDTIHGDVLTYTDNTTLFVIDSSTGRINFTPNDSHVSASPYHINITVTDTNGTVANRTILLTINNNTPPFFNATLPQLNCTTKSFCTLNLAPFTDDPDPGDSVNEFTATFIVGSLASFNLNTSSGLINFTTAKSDVGNYTINVTITDTFGATNSSVMNISINNTPEAPNLTQFNFSSQTIVETHLFTFEFQATDEDFLVASANEALNFTTNLSLAHSITPLATSNTTGRALFSITPLIGDTGNYTIQINVTDVFGLVDSEIITIEILPQVPAPNITNVTPWALPPNFTLQTSFQNASLFPSNAVTLTGQENTSVLFAVIVVDTQPLTYNWTVNGAQNATSENITLSFDFFSAGAYTVVVNVTNDRFESARFQWDLTIADVNRPPELINSLDDIPNVTLQLLNPNYFVGGLTLPTVKFYDPDDDLDSNGVIDGNETNGLTFSTISSCQPATLAISNADLTVTPQVVGSCIVRFNATDAGGLTLESNSVTINVTDVPEGETQTVTSSSGGGGGGSSSTSRFLPLTKDDEPKAFNLIVPKLVTIYDNNSVTIPITIDNTWTTPLEFVRLWAETNESNVEVSFDTNIFEEIPLNESRDVELTVTNYRFGDNYEVVVHANVSDPNFEDEALILLNSIEQASEGDQVKVKVTFANDLLNEHPECQELNEILDEARERFEQNDLSEARKLVDSVINGCKYLVSTQQRIDERPSKINPVITIDNLTIRTIMWSVLAFVLVLSVALLAYYHYSYKPEEDI